MMYRKSNRQTVAQRIKQRQQFVKRMQEVKDRMAALGITQAEICRLYMDRTGRANPAPRLSQLLEGNTMSAPLLDLINEVLLKREAKERNVA